MIISYQKKWVLSLVLLLLCSESQAREACGFSLALSNLFVEWQREGIETKEVFQIKLEESEHTQHDPACNNYFLTFGYGSGGSVGGGRRMSHSQGLPYSVKYNLYRRQNGHDILLDRPEVSSLDQTVFGQIEVDHHTLESAYFLRFESEARTGRVVHSGFYSDQIEVRLYSGGLESALLEDSRVLSIELFVEKQIELSLVDVGGGFDRYDTGQVLDFGELNEGKQVQCDVVVISNSGYGIELSSQHGGRLKHSSESRYVQYDAFWDGKRLPFSHVSRNAAIGAVLDKRATLTGEDRYRLELKVDELDQAMAGAYYDYITVTVSSTD